LRPRDVPRLQESFFALRPGTGERSAAALLAPGNPDKGRRLLEAFEDIRH